MISCNMLSIIRKAKLLTTFAFMSFSAFGQELNCNVVVNVGPQVETTERRVFQDMETSFFQFMNGRRWTNDVFTSSEKINCTILCV